MCESLAVLYCNKIRIIGEQGWHSGESTHLPSVWPGFDSRTWRHMWVEFVVGSRPCSEGFSPGCPVFVPPQNPTFQNSNLTWDARTPLNKLLELFGASWVNKLQKKKKYILIICFPFYSGPPSKSCADQIFHSPCPSMLQAEVSLFCFCFLLIFLSFLGENRNNKNIRRKKKQKNNTVRTLLAE